MGNVLKKVDFIVESHMVNENQGLMELAHISDMRHDRQLELLCHPYASASHPHSSRKDALKFVES